MSKANVTRGDRYKWSPDIGPNSPTITMQVECLLGDKGHFSARMVEPYDSKIEQAYTKVPDHWRKV